MLKTQEVKIWGLEVYMLLSKYASRTTVKGVARLCGLKSSTNQSIKQLFVFASMNSPKTCHNYEGDIFMVNIIVIDHGKLKESYSIPSQLDWNKSPNNNIVSII